MLCQFTFKNFKSYRDAATLDMRAASLKEFRDTLIEPGDPKFSPLLPIAAIYGANAGGKSNAVKALACLVSCVIRPVVACAGYENGAAPCDEDVQPFLFDGHSKDEPTEFEIFFRAGGAQYHYQLSVLRGMVFSESLFSAKYPCKRTSYTRLFERGVEGIKLGAALKKAKTGSVNPSVPLLSFLSIGYNFPEIQDVMRWFGRFRFSDCSIDVCKELKSPEVKKNVLKFFEAVDIPIVDFDIDERRVYATHVVNGKRYQIPLSEE